MQIHTNKREVPFFRVPDSISSRLPTGELGTPRVHTPGNMYSSEVGFAFFVPSNNAGFSTFNETRIRSL